MARRDRKAGRILEVVGGGIDFLGNVGDAMPVLRIIGHIIILPFRIAAHFMP